MDDKPAIVAGSTHTLRTRVDGSLSITIEVEPRHAQVAFSMFGTPGTPVAIARLVPEAAQQEAKREFIAQQEKESWGHVYKPLFSLGWFHNPRVIAAYGVDPRLPPQERIGLIGRAIYDCFDIESLTELEPQHFVAACDAMGIRDTLPASVIEAARGRAI